MKTRNQTEALSLLRDISLYRCMRYEQLVRLYPGKEEIVKKLLPYLAKQNRIRIRDGYCLAVDGKEEVDQSRITALWVLIDFIGQVEYHATHEFPSQIIFIANDEVYDIVYAEKGREALISQLMDAPKWKDANFLVIVDEEAQIPKLEKPSIIGYCTVSEDGTVTYYQEEGG